jgi:hypothetical protein
MSLEKFDDDCPGCRPAAMDIETGERMPDDSAVMKLAFAWFETLNRSEKEVWHRCTCQNSRTPLDLWQFETLARDMQLFMDRHSDKEVKK